MHAYTRRAPGLTLRVYCIFRMYSAGVNPTILGGLTLALDLSGVNRYVWVYIYIYIYIYNRVGRCVRGRVIAYFLFSKWQPSAILDFHIFPILWEKNQNCAYFYVVMQNLVKIGQCAAELLGNFDFQNGGRPPSWIWYDVIADHPRLVIDGPNILLKLHVYRVNILRDIAIFIFGPFGLKLPIHVHFGEFWGI